MKQSRSAHLLGRALILFTLSLMGGLALAKGDQQMFEVLVRFAVFSLGLYTATLVHEFGHIWAAQLVGWRAFRIVWGIGPLKWERRILGIPVEARKIRMGGFAFVAPRNPHAFPVKAVIVMLGGVTANLVAGSLGYIIEAWWHTLFNIRRTGSPTPGSCWFFAHAAMVFNLVPFSFQSTYGKMSSDGLAILKALFRPATYKAELEKTAMSLEFIETRKEERFESALKIMESAAERFPEEPAFQMYMICAYSDLERYAEGEAVARRLLDTGKVEPVMKSLLVNNLAFCLLMQGNPDKLPEARLHAEAAYAAMPWLCYVQGTLGGVKVAQGELTEGKALLEKATAGLEEPRSLKLNAQFIELANKKLRALKSSSGNG